MGCKRKAAVRGVRLLEESRVKSTAHWTPATGSVPTTTSSIAKRQYSDKIDSALQPLRQQSIRYFHVLLFAGENVPHLRFSLPLELKRRAKMHMSFTYSVFFFSISVH